MTLGSLGSPPDGRTGSSPTPERRQELSTQGNNNTRNRNNTQPRQQQRIIYVTHGLLQSENENLVG